MKLPDNVVPQTMTHGQLLIYCAELDEANRRLQTTGTTLTDRVRAMRSALLVRFSLLANEAAPSHTLFSVLLDLLKVRYCSDCKYKTVTHYLDKSDGTGGSDARAFLEIARGELTRYADRDAIPWRALLECEVAETFAETDPQRLEDELLDVANVATKWAQAIRLRRERDGR